RNAIHASGFPKPTGVCRISRKVRKYRPRLRQNSTFMRRFIFLATLACLAVLSGLLLQGADATNQAKLIVLDPDHFHAALIQEDMYPSLAEQVSVYAPLGPDALDYLQR